MTRRQRLANLAIAAVIALVAVVVIATNSSDDEDPAAQPAATAPAQAGSEEPSQATSTPEPDPSPEPVASVVFRDGEVVGGVERIEVSEGDRVRFDITSDVTEHVHVHAYDLFADLEPGKRERISFEATITGVIEVELEDSGTEVVELRVEP